MKSLNTAFSFAPPSILSLTILSHFRHIMYSLQILNLIESNISKRQIMRQSLNSTPPVMGGAASGIRPEDYLTMA